MASKARICCAALGLLGATAGPAPARVFIDPVYAVEDGRCMQYARGPEAATMLQLAGLSARHRWSATVCTADDGSVTGRFVDARGRVVCEIRGTYDQERGCFDALSTFCADGRSVDRVGLCGW